MKRIRVILLSLLGIAAAVGAVLFALEYFQPKGAGIFIETTPESTVYIDGERVGRTPYRETHPAQEIIVKLIPESFETPLVPYETKITLTPGVETVVRRQFGETEDVSSGEIVSFEKTEKDETSLVVVSIPDNAQVYLDGEISGFAPYRTSAIVPGEHTLRVGSTGYEDKNLLVNTQEGYKLTAVVKLATSDVVVVEEEVDEPEKEEQEMVLISETPTGFLRVREDASTLSSEITQVEPGETYVLLETDKSTGWYKIQVDEETAGWISNDYAEMVNEVASEEEATSSGAIQ